MNRYDSYSNYSNSYSRSSYRERPENSYGYKKPEFSTSDTNYADYDNYSKYDKYNKYFQMDENYFDNHPEDSAPANENPNVNYNFSAASEIPTSDYKN